MEREILVSADHVETRVALLESGTIVEVAIERHRDRSRVGNIYKGKVNRVLPGMQSAFLDIGLERDAFLHVTDLPLAAPPPPSTFTGPRPPVSLPPIESLIQEGQSLLVQVVKEAISGKGARVTGSVTLPARYLVLAPFTAHIGVSRKILSEAER
ncbi:MAG: Rne/Rng family ribonuclease, partial [Acidobacteriota bacterium]